MGGSNLPHPRRPAHIPGVRSIVLSSLLVVACGASASEPAVAPKSSEAKPTHGVTRPTPPPPGAVWRHDVRAIVDAGLGRFLQRVDVEPSLAGNSFVGFRIVALRPAQWWHGVDLKPGDVVTAVNGMPIERDIEAYEAFKSLVSAEAIRVSYLRDGQRQELVYRIVDKEGAAGAKPDAGPSAQPDHATKPGEAQPEPTPKDTGLDGGSKPKGDGTSEGNPKKKLEKR